MSSPTAPPISKVPAERTFVVAVTVLCIAAAIQLVALVAALADQADFSRLLRPSPATARTAATGPAAATATPSLQAMQQANAFMNEAQEFREKGNFRGALEAVAEADRLFPGKPGILIQMAADHLSLGQQAEGVAVLQRIVALPPSDDPADKPFIDQARGALTQYGVNPDAPATLGALPSAAGAVGATGSDPAAATTQLDANATGVRDDVGVPIGSVMGVITTSFTDVAPGQKALKIAVKAGSGEKIDPSKFSANVNFYERTDTGDVQQAQGRQPYEWLSPPIDWQAGEPEIFQIRYRVPPADRGDLPPIQYYGYVVAIYYNGELQDSRAEPVSLLDQFAPPLSKEPSSISE